jgi:hypothetical protein
MATQFWQTVIRSIKFQSSLNNLDDMPRGILPNRNPDGEITPEMHIPILYQFHSQWVAGLRQKVLQIASRILKNLKDISNLTKSDG